MTDAFKTLGVKITADLSELPGQAEEAAKILEGIQGKGTIKVSLQGFSDKQVENLQKAAAAIATINRATAGGSQATPMGSGPGTASKRLLPGENDWGGPESLVVRNVDRSMPSGSSGAGTLKVDAEVKAVAAQVRGQIEAALKDPFDIHLNIANLDELKRQIAELGGVSFTAHVSGETSHAGAAPASGGAAAETPRPEPMPSSAPKSYSYSREFSNLFGPKTNTAAWTQTLYSAIQESRKATKQALMREVTDVKDMFAVIAENYGDSLDDLVQLSPQVTRELPNGEKVKLARKIVGGNIAPLATAEDPALQGAVRNFASIAGGVYPHWQAMGGSRNRPDEPSSAPPTPHAAAHIDPVVKATVENTEATRAATAAATDPTPAAKTAGEKVVNDAMKNAGNAPRSNQDGLVGVVQKRSIMDILNQVQSMGQLRNQAGAPNPRSLESVGRVQQFAAMSGIDYGLGRNIRPEERAFTEFGIDPNRMSANPQWSRGGVNKKATRSKKGKAGAEAMQAYAALNQLDYGLGEPGVNPYEQAMAQYGVDYTRMSQNIGWATGGAPNVPRVKASGGGKFMPHEVEMRSVAAAANVLNPGVSSPLMPGGRLTVNGVDLTSIFEEAKAHGFRGYAERLGARGKGTGEFVQAAYDETPDNIVRNRAGNAVLNPGDKGEIPGMEGTFQGVNPGEMVRRLLAGMGITGEPVEKLLGTSHNKDGIPTVGTLNYALQAGGRVPLPQALRSGTAKGGLYTAERGTFARPGDGLEVENRYQEGPDGVMRPAGGVIVTRKANARTPFEVSAGRILAQAGGGWNGMTQEHENPEAYEAAQKYLQAEINAAHNAAQERGRAFVGQSSSIPWAGPQGYQGSGYYTPGPGGEPTWVTGSIDDATSEERTRAAAVKKEKAYMNANPDLDRALAYVTEDLWTRALKGDLPVNQIDRATGKTLLDESGNPVPIPHRNASGAIDPTRPMTAHDSLAYVYEELQDNIADILGLTGQNRADPKKFRSAATRLGFSQVGGMFQALHSSLANVRGSARTYDPHGGPKGEGRWLAGTGAIGAAERLADADNRTAPTDRDYVHPTKTLTDDRIDKLQRELDVVTNTRSIGVRANKGGAATFTYRMGDAPIYKEQDGEYVLKGSSADQDANKGMTSQPVPAPIFRTSEGGDVDPLAFQKLTGVPLATDLGDTGGEALGNAGGAQQGILPAFPKKLTKEQYDTWQKAIADRQAEMERLKGIKAAATAYGNREEFQGLSSKTVSSMAHEEISDPDFLDELDEQLLGPKNAKGIRRGGRAPGFLGKTVLKKKYRSLVTGNAMNYRVQQDVGIPGVEQEIFHNGTAIPGSGVRDTVDETIGRMAATGGGGGGRGERPTGTGGGAEEEGDNTARALGSGGVVDVRVINEPTVRVAGMSSGNTRRGPGVPAGLEGLGGTGPKTVSQNLAKSGDYGKVRDALVKAYPDLKNDHPALVEALDKLGWGAYASAEFGKGGKRTGPSSGGGKPQKKIWYRHGEAPARGDGSIDDYGTFRNMDPAGDALKRQKDKEVAAANRGAANRGRGFVTDEARRKREVEQQALYERLASQIGRREDAAQKSTDSQQARYMRAQGLIGGNLINFSGVPQPGSYSRMSESPQARAADAARMQASVDRTNAVMDRQALRSSTRELKIQGQQATADARQNDAAQKAAKAKFDQDMKQAEKDAQASAKASETQRAQDEFNRTGRPAGFVGPEFAPGVFTTGQRRDYQRRNEKAARDAQRQTEIDEHMRTGRPFLPRGQGLAVGPMPAPGVFTGAQFNRLNQARGARTSGRIGMTPNEQRAAFRAAGTDEDVIERMFPKPSRSMLDDATQERLINSRQAAAAARASLPSRAPSTMMVQMTQRLLGVRDAPERRILALQQEVADETRLAGIAGKQTAKTSAAREQAKITQGEINRMVASGITPSPDVKRAHAENLKHLREENKLRRIANAELNKQSDKVLKAAEAPITKREMGANLMAGFIGGIAGGLVTGVISAATSAITEVVTKGMVPVVDRMTGNQLRANAVNTEMAGSLAGAQYNRVGVMGTLAQQGFSAQGMGMTMPGLMLGAGGQAGADQLQQRIESTIAAAANARQAREMGLPEGVSPITTRTQGAAFQFGLGPLGDFSIGGTGSTQEKVFNQLQQLPMAKGETLGGYTNEQIDAVPGLSDWNREQAKKALAGTKSDPTNGANFQVLKDLLGERAPRDSRGMPILNKDQQTETDLLLAPFGGKIKVVSDAESKRQADIVRQDPRLATFADWLEKSSTGFSDFTGSLSDAYKNLQAINAGRVDLGSWISTQKELALPNQLAMMEKQFGLQQQQTRAGFALNQLANPVMPYGVGIPFGGQGLPGHPSYKSGMKTLTGLQTQNQADLTSLLGNDPEAQKQLDLMTDAAQAIQDLNIAAADVQKIQVEREYNHQLFIQKRTVSDLAGLVGKANSSELGQMERKNLMASRQLQTMQFQDQQMSLNYQRALAGFTYTGATGEEAAARRRIAEIQASRAQKELDISKGIVKTGYKIVDEQNLRAFRDAAWTVMNTVKTMKESRTMASLQAAIQVQTRLEQQYETNVQQYLGYGAELKKAGLQWAGAAADATGKLLTDVLDESLKAFEDGINRARALEGKAPLDFGRRAANSSGSPDDRDNPEGSGGISPREARMAAGRSTTVTFDFRGSQVRSDDDIHEIVRKVEEALNRKSALFGLRRL